MPVGASRLLRDASCFPRQPPRGGSGEPRLPPQTPVSRGSLRSRWQGVPGWLVRTLPGATCGAVPGVTATCAPGPCHACLICAESRCRRRAACHAGATEPAPVALWPVTSGFGAPLCRGRVPPASLGAAAGHRDLLGWFLPGPRSHPTGVGTGGAGAAGGSLPRGAGRGHRVGPPDLHVLAASTPLSPDAWLPSWDSGARNRVPVTGVVLGSGPGFGPFAGTGCVLGNRGAAKAKLPGRVGTATRLFSAPPSSG